MSAAIWLRGAALALLALAASCMTTGRSIDSTASAPRGRGDRKTAERSRSERDGDDIGLASDNSRDRKRTDSGEERDGNPFRKRELASRSDDAGDRRAEADEGPRPRALARNSARDPEADEKRSNKPASDAEVRQLIADELPDLTLRESQELERELAGLDPALARSLIKIHHMTRQYNRGSTALASRDERTDSRKGIETSGSERSPPGLLGAERSMGREISEAERGAAAAALSALSNAGSGMGGNRNLSPNALVNAMASLPPAGNEHSPVLPGAAPGSNNWPGNAPAADNRVASAPPAGPGNAPQPGVAPASWLNGGTRRDIGSPVVQAGYNDLAALGPAGNPAAFGPAGGPLNRAVAVPGAVPPGSTSAPLTPRHLEETQRLIAVAESDLARVRLTQTSTDDDRRRYVEQHVHLRMLYLMAGQNERAMQAIPGIDAADQEFWQQMFWAVANYFDGQTMPNRGDRASQTAAQLRTAIHRLQETARLELRNVSFCHEITSYGTYQRFPRDEFSAEQAVLVYAEVNNFKSVPAADGQYLTRLRSTVEIYTPSGGLVDRINFQEQEDVCRNQRRDYFQSHQFNISEKATLGPHVLKLIVEDLLSQKVAEYTVNFTVK